MVAHTILFDSNHQAVQQTDGTWVVIKGDRVRMQSRANYPTSAKALKALLKDEIQWGGLKQQETRTADGR